MRGDPRIPTNRGNHSLKVSMKTNKRDVTPSKSLKIIGHKRILKREKAYKFNKWEEELKKARVKVNYSDYTNKTVSNIGNIIMNTCEAVTQWGEDNII